MKISQESKIQNQCEVPIEDVLARLNDGCMSGGVEQCTGFPFVFGDWLRGPTNPCGPLGSVSSMFRRGPPLTDLFADRDRLNVKQCLSDMIQKVCTIKKQMYTCIYLKCVTNELLLIK